MSLSCQLDSPDRAIAGCEEAGDTAPACAALELSGYGVSFDGRVILSAVDLSLSSHGIDVLMGPPQAGRSTLLRSLAGLNNANALFRCWGSSRMGGRALDHHWRPALVQPHAALLRGSVGAALVHQLKQQNRPSTTCWTDLASEAAEQFNVAPLLRHGLEGPMIEEPAEMQRQVNILSYVLTQPPLLLIDEPTHGLDEAAAERLLAWLAQLGTRQRLLVALNDRRQAGRLANRFIHIGAGRVLAFGHEPSPIVSARMPPAWADQPRRPLAALPAMGAHGVDAASMVGVAMMAERRGPAGFQWIDPGRLAGCPQPGACERIEQDLALLNAVGITRLITLTPCDLDQGALCDAGLKNLHLPIFDGEAPSLSQAYMLVHRMQLLLEGGHNLAVHCQAGIGCTGTVLACWLIREGGLSAASALQRLRMINPAYVRTEAQEGFLDAFEQDIHLRTRLRESAPAHHGAARASPLEV